MTVSPTALGNSVLFGRIPPLFVHAMLTDPVLGEGAGHPPHGLSSNKMALILSDIGKMRFLIIKWL